MKPIEHLALSYIREALTSLSIHSDDNSDSSDSNTEAPSLQQEANNEDTKTDSQARAQKAEIDEDKVNNAYRIIKEFLDRNIINEEQCRKMVEMQIGCSEPFDRIARIVHVASDANNNNKGADDDEEPEKIIGAHCIRSWTENENQRLLAGIYLYEYNWIRVAEFVGNNRTKAQCSQRWLRCLDPRICKGPWTDEEDDVLISLLAKHGDKAWKKIAQEMPHRSDVQCRYHYMQLLKGKVMKSDSSEPMSPEYNEMDFVHKKKKHQAHHSTYSNEQHSKQNGKQQSNHNKQKHQKQQQQQQQMQEIQQMQQQQFQQMQQQQQQLMQIQQQQIQQQQMFQIQQAPAQTQPMFVQADIMPQENKPQDMKEQAQLKQSKSSSILESENIFGEWPMNQTLSSEFRWLTESLPLDWM